MAAELETPTDKYGLPLPIAPDVENQLPLNRPDIADWHHHFHPASHPLLQTIGGRALRQSRVQLVARKHHNETDTRYHRFFAGPVIPTDEDEQFRILLLACAGYLPEHGIDLSSGEPKEVKLSALQISMIRGHDLPDKPFSEDPQIRSTALFGNRNLRYSYSQIREFFTYYALRQPISHLRESEVDEFLHTTDESRHQFLGHYLLAKKVEVAADPVSGVYRAEHSDGRLHTLMPRRPQALLKHKLGTQTRREEVIFPVLRTSLLGIAV